MTDIEAAETETPVAVADAAFLRNAIRENEHWNARGITEPDLAVLLEMSPQCGWGSRYRKSRFNAGMRLLARRSDVTKRARRWFLASSTALEALDETGERVCEACGASLIGKRAGARWCDRCRDRMRLRRQRERRAAA